MSAIHYQLSFYLPAFFHFDWLVPTICAGLSIVLMRDDVPDWHINAGSTGSREQQAVVAPGQPFIHTGSVCPQRIPARSDNHTIVKGINPVSTLVSKKRKFIFIHIYKVAGHSLSSALETCEEWYMVKNVMRFVWRFSLINAPTARRWLGLQNVYPFMDHASARDVKPLVPEFDTYFRFCFVRNPWDWQVSLFHYARQRWYHHQHRLFAADSFSDYIEWRCNGRPTQQKDFITDFDGTVLMNFIGRLENIHDDFSYVCDRIGITNTLPHLNKSTHQQYRSYYTTHTRALVERAFQEDIELFKYTF